jgi:hypothetical protein
VSLALNPEMTQSIEASKRHEIGIHGWIHEHLGVLNNEKEEQQLLNQSIDALTKAIGRRPVGYRAPSWVSPFTMGQVKAAGFLYDSSLMASDDAYEVTIDGVPSGVIELPIERILDDAPYYGAASGSLPSGQLSSTFGSFLLRYDDAVNPLPGIPSTYGYYAPISPLGLAGAEVNATTGRLDMRAQFVNSSPAIPRAITAADQYGNWAGGAGFRIRQGFRIGASTYREPFSIATANSISLERKHLADFRPRRLEWM